MAASAAARTAYVANFMSDNVTPIDTATNAAGAPIPVGVAPRGIAITPDGETAYVTDDFSNGVTPIDTATNTAGTPIAVETHPTGVAITPDGKTAYVTNSGSDNVTPIDTATNSAGAPIPVGAFPFAIAITPDGKTAYVANLFSDNVTPIDTATNTAGTPITVNSPAGIAITPDGKTAYVADEVSNKVIPIDTATSVAGTPITVDGSSGGIAITPDGKTAYATGNETVFPIDTATNTAETPITVGSNPAGIAITPDGRTAYVSHAYAFDNKVTPIETATNVAGPPIAVGTNPIGIAIVPDQAPLAAFTASSATVGHAVTFDASGSSDPDGTIASYQWDFGDGASATTSSPTIVHAYAAAGNYTAVLTVTDNEGCSTAFIFTGQTASCHGSAAARSEQEVSLPRAPSTAIAKATINRRRHEAEFRFKAIGQASGFQCKLERAGHHRRKARFHACDSPKRYKHLKLGGYVFAVRAVGPGGTDRSPARRPFKVKRRGPRAPSTAITKAKIDRRHHRAEFRFKAIGQGSGFQCKLERAGHHRRKARFHACDSPKRYKHLKLGGYVFAVRAVGPGGTDRSPARRPFDVKRRGEARLGDSDRS